MLHRFSDARHHLAQASLGGAPRQMSSAAVERRSGVRRESGHGAGRAAQDRAKSGDWKTGRARRTAGGFGRIRRRRPIYRQALREYRDVSPFPVAWVCFQLGVLWGELVPEPQLARAEHWYRKAIVCLPRYVKARVHLAEIYSATGRASDAEALLMPAIASGDPEVRGG